MKIWLQLFICLMMFVGCGKKPPIEKMTPCAVDLTLEPGESCRYTNSNDSLTFDFIFSVLDGGIHFPRMYLKSPEGIYGPESGPIIVGGGTSSSGSGDKKIIINSSTVQVCSGGKILEIKGASGSRIILPNRVGQKCFFATKNRNGSWTIKQLPRLTQSIPR